MSAEKQDHLFPMTPEEQIVQQLREQIAEIERKKAEEHKARTLMDEAESLRKQLRSYGVTPVV